MKARLRKIIPLLPIILLPATGHAQGIQKYKNCLYAEYGLVQYNNSGRELLGEHSNLLSFGLGYNRDILSFLALGLKVKYYQQAIFPGPNTVGSNTAQFQIRLQRPRISRTFRLRRLSPYFETGIGRATTFIDGNMEQATTEYTYVPLLAGIDYHFSDHWALGIQGEYRLSGKDINTVRADLRKALDPFNTVSLRLSFCFGQTRRQASVPRVYTRPSLSIPSPSSTYDGPVQGNTSTADSAVLKPVSRGPKLQNRDNTIPVATEVIALQRTDTQTIGYLSAADSMSMHITDSAGQVLLTGTAPVQKESATFVQTDTPSFGQKAALIPDTVFVTKKDTVFLAKTDTVLRYKRDTVIQVQTDTIRIKDSLHTLSNTSTGSQQSGQQPVLLQADTQAVSGSPNEIENRKILEEKVRQMEAENTDLRSRLTDLEQSRAIEDSLRGAAQIPVAPPRQQNLLPAAVPGNPKTNNNLVVVPIPLGLGNKKDKKANTDALTRNQDSILNRLGQIEDELEKIQQPKVVKTDTLMLPAVRIAADSSVMIPADTAFIADTLAIPADTLAYKSRDSVRSKLERQVGRLQDENDALQQLLSSNTGKDKNKGEQSTDIKSLEQDIYFEVNQYKADSTAQVQLTQLADTLNNGRTNWVLLEGFTDKSGSAAYNLQLAKKRVQSVKDFFIEKGIPKERILEKIFGSRFSTGVSNSNDRKVRVTQILRR